MAIKAILYLLVTLFFWFKAIKKPILGVCFFAAIVFIRPETIAYRQLDFLHISLTTSIFCLISLFLNKKKIGSPVRTNLLPAHFMFCLAGYISTCFSEVISIWRWPGEHLKIFIFCFLMTRLITNMRNLDLFILAILLGVSFLSVWGVDQHFRGNYRLEGVGGNRFASNEFGAILAMIFPLFLFKARGLLPAFQKKALVKAERFFFGIALFFVLATIQFTSSRGAFLALCTSCFILFVRSKSKLKSLMFMFILLPIVFINLEDSYKKRILTIFNPKIADVANKGASVTEDTEEVDGSIKGRLVFWRAALKMFTDHKILGVGLQNAELLIPKYTGGQYPKAKDIHNMFLKILSETGLMGSIFYLFLIVSTLLNFNKVQKGRGVSSKLLFYSQALEAGFVGFLVSALTGSYTYNEPFFWLIMLSGAVKVFYEREISKMSKGGGLCAE